MDKLKNINVNEEEIKFMDLFSEELQIFTKCSEEDALGFVCMLLDKITDKNIKISKIKELK